MSNTQAYTGGSIPGETLALEGNTGGLVSPNGAGTIFVVGDGTTVNVAGDPGTNTLTISASGAETITSINHASSPYTVLATDEVILADVTAGVITVNLPNTTFTSRTGYIKDVAGLSATSAISITTPGGIVTIDKQTTYTINVNFECIKWIFDGTNYEVL